MKDRCCVLLAGGMLLACSSDPKRVDEVAVDRGRVSLDDTSGKESSEDLGEPRDLTHPRDEGSASLDVGVLGTDIAQTDVVGDSGEALDVDASPVGPTDVADPAGDVSLDTGDEDIVEPTDEGPEDGADLDAAVADDVLELPCGADADCAELVSELKPCERVLCLDGGCALEAVEPGGGCDDQDPCTEPDTCTAEGECLGLQRLCSDGDPCTIDTCERSAGLCVHEDAGEGAACDDGDACTDRDRCAGGICSGERASCDDGNPCTLDRCDEGTGACLHDALDDVGQPCDDGEACTENDRCRGSSCEGNQRICDDGLDCTFDRCIEEAGDCEHASGPREGEPCEDGLVCTEAGKCQSGQCVGKPTNCDDDDPCTRDACNEILGGCHHQPISGCDRPCSRDSDCEDPSDLCVVGFCSGGACQFMPADCDDGDACTADSCLPEDGCLSEPVDCDDGDPCTEDWCDPALGECLYAPLLECGEGPCNEDEDCWAQIDVCVAGLCVGGTCLSVPVDCDDGDVCTQDLCDQRLAASTNR